MNIFFIVFILTTFFFSLRIVDNVRYKKLKSSITKEEENFLKELGFFKDE